MVLFGPGTMRAEHTGVGGRIGHARVRGHGGGTVLVRSGRRCRGLPVRVLSSPERRHWFSPSLRPVCRIAPGSSWPWRRRRGRPRGVRADHLSHADAQLFGRWRDRGGLGGRDTPVVDVDGLTVVDRRWLRWKDRSFSPHWKELESIRLVSVPNGSSYGVIVSLRENHASFAVKHDLTELDGGHAIAALRLGTDTTKRAEMLPALRSEPARFGGEKYRS